MAFLLRAHYKCCECEYEYEYEYGQWALDVVLRLDQQASSSSRYWMYAVITKTRTWK